MHPRLIHARADPCCEARSLGLLMGSKRSLRITSSRRRRNVITWPVDAKGLAIECDAVELHGVVSVAYCAHFNKGELLLS